MRGRLAGGALLVFDLAVWAWVLLLAVAREVRSVVLGAGGWVTGNGLTRGVLPAGREGRNRVPNNNTAVRLGLVGQSVPLLRGGPGQMIGASPPPPLPLLWPPPLFRRRFIGVVIRTG